MRGKSWGMKEHMENNLNKGWKGTEQRECLGMEMEDEYWSMFIFNLKSKQSTGEF